MTEATASTNGSVPTVLLYVSHPATAVADLIRSAVRAYANA